MARHPIVKQVGVHPLINPLTFAQFVEHGMSLEVRCWAKGCKRVVNFDGDRLVLEFGAATTVRQIANRLRIAGAYGGDHRVEEGMTLPKLDRWRPGKRREPQWPHG